MVHNHTFGSCVGLLNVNDAGLSYVSTDNADDSQSWSWSEVVRFEYDGPALTVVHRDGAKRKKTRFKLVDGALAVEPKRFLETHLGP